jgi:hypothetical protein
VRSSSKRSPPSVEPFDPSYLVEREARGRDLRDKVESMDEVRARLILTPAKGP